ncbi:hypothetical protein KW794_00350 [Candidatus Saccharibacteria bacterium]|nr:hypothetical protein [Candidatus Saccharibacteria bacterium]
MNYFITGNVGAGKSSVISELKKRGFAAYDTDEVDRATILIEKKTGKEVPWPDPPIDWSKYSYVWQPDKIKQLLNSGKPVFIGAIVGNQENFYHLFDKIFVLDLDIETLKQRILTRTSKGYGKHPTQLAEILEYHKELNPELLSLDKSIAIDSTKSLKQVVDDILANLK